jgi:hypothetical protein
MRKKQRRKRKKRNEEIGAEGTGSLREKRPKRDGSG